MENQDMFAFQLDENLKEWLQLTTKLAHAKENNYSDKTKSIDFSECQSDDQELRKSSHHISSNCAPSSRITEDCLWGSILRGYDVLESN